MNIDLNIDLMQAIHTSSPKLPSLLEDLPTCKVVIIYQDHPAGRQAMKILYRLEETFQKDCLFWPCLWTFDLLASPCLREEVTQDAAQADMIFFAWRETEAFSVEVKSWLEQWLILKGPQDTALVAIDCGGRHANGSQMVAYLRKIAGQGGMDFFSQRQEIPGLGPHHFLQSDATPYAGSEPRWRDIQPFDRGGLNE